GGIDDEYRVIGMVRRKGTGYRDGVDVALWRQDDDAIPFWAVRRASSSHDAANPNRRRLYRHTPTFFLHRRPYASPSGRWYRTTRRFRKYRIPSIPRACRWQDRAPTSREVRFHAKHPPRRHRSRCRRRPTFFLHRRPYASPSGRWYRTTRRFRKYRIPSIPPAFRPSPRQVAPSAGDRARNSHGGPAFWHWPGRWSDERSRARKTARPSRRARR